MEEITEPEATVAPVLPWPEPGDPLWVVDALARPTDPGVQMLLAADVAERTLDIARLASTGIALLTFLGAPSFQDVSAADLENLTLTPDQGRAWQTVPGVLSVLRITVSGKSRGLKFVVCTGCGRWMVSKKVPTAKSCPLTMDCTGPLVGIPGGTPTTAPAVHFT
ncbi:hypothetical protein [Ornithinimicrobium murale]|uniref:hypothetical protein n=1 Tax=Ornithinimicrobium murale TaxID=1050153 RepID=UPI000E0DFF0A|nr:hypothetical protein [Ornithinimicrobium murale]